MKALVYKGKGQCALEDRPMPEIQDPTDAIVKGTLEESGQGGSQSELDNFLRM